MEVRSLVVLALLVAGCSGGAEAPQSPPPPRPAASGEAPVGAALEGVAGPLLGHEELEAIMKTNKAQMMRIKAAVAAGDKESILAAVVVMEEGATNAMRSKPPRNADRMAAYLAAFGAHKAALAGLKAMVETAGPAACEPGFEALGGTCAACHQQFKPEKPPK